MKISLILILALVLHAASPSEIPKRAKAPAPIPRPSSFASNVVSLLAQMATANRYQRYDKCHILPWQFLRDMVVKYNSKKLSKSAMKRFINDLAKIHKGAAYYSALPSGTKTTLATLTKTYQTNAIKAVDSGNTKNLITALYNMPSNLYPGDPTNNRSIQNNIDAPKEASTSGGRTTAATTTAVTLFSKYKSHGLTKLSKPGNPKMAKSSDKPPGDTTGDYVTL